MDDAIKPFDDELQQLTKKHGITCAAFTGRMGDNYIGMIVGKMKPSELVDTALNVGRLWQHLRQQIKGFLDEFEKIW